MFAVRVIAVVLSLWITAQAVCVADDAATLDAWQSSFRDVWLADTCVQEFQSWNKYWGAVHGFYFGEKGYDGWFALSKTWLAHVTDATANATVSADLTLLGRRAGGEWAKEDGCRKVRSRSTMMARLTEPDKPALFDWVTQLNKAATADAGSGQSIEAAIKSINKQLDALGIATPT